jgi:hypothetical protein
VPPEVREAKNGTATEVDAAPMERDFEASRTRRHLDGYLDCGAHYDWQALDCYEKISEKKFETAPEKGLGER